MTENQPRPPMTVRMTATAGGGLVGVVSGEDFAALSNPADEALSSPPAAVPAPDSVSEPRGAVLSDLGRQEEPAERLRCAAELIERRAVDATPGPWVRRRNGAVPVTYVSADLPDGEQGRYIDGTLRDGSREQVTVCRAQTWEGLGSFVRERSGRDLDWITLMNPQVAAPVAAWLRSGADHCAKFGDEIVPQPTAQRLAALIAHHFRHELAVADALLGAEDAR